MSEQQEIRYIAQQFSYDWAALAEANPPPKKVTDSFFKLEHYFEMFMTFLLPHLEEEYKKYWNKKDDPDIGFSYVDETLVITFTINQEVTEYYILNMPDGIKHLILGAFLLMRKRLVVEAMKKTHEDCSGQAREGPAV